MSIHENLGELVEITEEPKIFGENIKMDINPLDEKVEEPKGIHATKPINKHIRQQKFVSAAAHRKNIMKNAINYNQNNKKECIQSMIRASRKPSYRESIQSKLDRLRKTTEPHKIPQQKSFGLSNPVKSREYEYKKNNEFSSLNSSGNKWTIIENENKWIPFFPVNKEEPKPVINLGEIVSKICIEVIAGKINNLEDVIGKLRLSYEDNSKFTNANKKYVSWLNFEDDTCKPVLKISDEKMAIINKWYNECNLILDVENTEVFIPESIPVQDLSGILFNEINCKYKEEYLNNYLPMVINNLITSYNIKNYEKKYFTKDNSLFYGMVNQIFHYSLSSSSAPTSSSAVNYANVYSSLGLIIPDNLSDIVRSEQKTNNVLSAAVGTYKVSNIGLRSEPAVIPHFSEPFVSTSNGSASNNVQPYNFTDNITINPLNDDDNKRKLIYHPYNQDYNILNPEFDRNVFSLNLAGIVNNIDIQKKYSNVTVILNTKFLQTLYILNPNADELAILNNNVEYGFIKLFSLNTLSNDVIKFVSNEYDKAQFDNIDELNQKLQVTSQYIDFSVKHSPETDTTTEESIVKKYILSSFTIDNDINNKMKASVLHDTIVNSNVVTIEKSRLNGFKNRLSVYLKNLGLEKKRYNDGYYYYGIQAKKTFSGNERIGMSYQEIIAERNKPFEFNNTEFEFCTPFYKKKPMDAFYEAFNTNIKEADEEISGSKNLHKIVKNMMNEFK